MNFKMPSKRLLLCHSFQINHMRTLSDFVEAQACYFDQCHQHAQDLQKQLARCVCNTKTQSL